MTSLTDMLEQLSPEQRELFEMLLQEKREQSQQARQAIGPRADQRSFPLSFGQQRLWFIHQWEPQSPAYNLPQAVHLRGRPDIATLERCLNEIVRRHETLRSRFESHDGQPVQIIEPELALALPLERVDQGPPEQRGAAVQRRLIEEARRPFDLERGPLLRARLFQLDQDENVILLTMHHIISDGWSNGVLVRELGTLYHAFAAGQPAPLEPLPLQYADFAAWQRGWLDGEVLERQLAYWRAQLAGAPPLLALPTDRPRPAVQRYHGAVQPFRVAPTLTEALKALAQRENSSLFMVLMAAFQVLLYRYSGQEDILVGTPVANRTRTEIEGLIGFFVNTLVLRADLAGAPSFRALLGQIRQTTLAMQDHQDLPFERLVEELQLERNTSYAPLFQVGMALQNAPLPELRAPGLTLTPLELDDGTAQFDLHLELYEAADGLRARLKYNTDLFDPATAARMAEHFQTLLAGIAASPDESVERLPLLTAEQRRHMLGRHARTRPFPAERTLHGWFAAQAARTPEQTALVDGETRLTYRELDRRSSQLAHALRARGVAPAALVGLCVERSAEVVVGILGILKAGCAYLPLDPAYPAERLAFMLADSQAQALVLQREQDAWGELAGPDGRPLTTLCLERDRAAIERQPEHPPEEQVAPDSLAYVIYTSGSTGTPKGCLITHANVVRLFSATEHWYGFGQHDVWTLFHSYTFDFSVWEIWGALLYGGRLVVVPYHTSRSPEAFYDLLARERVTVLNQTPSAFRQLSAVEEGRDAPADLALRYVIFGGEALEFASLRGWFARHDDTRPQLVNMYGITETTVHVTYRPIRRQDVEQGSPSLIGVPIGDLALYLLDSQGAPVPVGVPGELYVGGAGVARGYLNRPELTEARFVPNPFAAELQVQGSGFGEPDLSPRLYRTGDRARYLASGEIEYMGRLDQQVKIRGFRIELGEIEAALGRCAGVRAAVVEARAEPPGETRLVAYVVPSAAEAPPAAALRAALLERLPDYMVPSAFVALAALPLTSSGKVDRRALPAPAGLRPDLGAPLVQPRTPTEMELSLIWSEVLALDSVGVEDNFFDLGGHSLLATQVMSRVSKTFAVQLPLRTLFDHPTVARLALQVEQACASRDGTPPPPIVAVPRGRPFPLSFAQEQMWVTDQLAPGNVAYVIPAMARVSGPLDTDLLRRCFDVLVQRHEIFRTTYSYVTNEPVQVIHPAEPFLLSVADLRAAPDPEEQAKRLAREAARQPIDLGSGPIVRAVVYQIGDQEFAVLLLMHHIVVDRWSSPLLIRELRELYEALLAGRPPALPALPIQYADFAHWQRGWLRGAVLETQLAYWRAQLAGAPTFVDLPTDRPRPAVQTFRGAFLIRPLPAELFARIQELGRAAHTTLFMTFLSAFYVLLYRYSGQGDMVLGTPITTRAHVEVEELIGDFLNTLLLRIDLSDSPSFRELLARVRDMCLSAYAHQDLQFERLVQELQPARDTSRNALYNIMFVFSPNYPMADVRSSDLTVSHMFLSGEVARRDMTMYTFVSAEGQAAVQLNYNIDLFHHDTVERMLDHFIGLLHAVVARPEQPVGQIAMLRPDEIQRMVYGWNATRRPYRRDLCIHDLFAAQAGRTPEALAGIFEGRSLTYRELERWSNQIAALLRELGVRPGRYVGVYLRRSLEMLPVLLGILKAGGAYVPMESSFPPARIEGILGLLDVGCLISQPDLLPTVQELAPQLPALRHVLCLGEQSQSGAADGLRIWSDADLAAQPDRAAPPAAGADDIAYVIFTSGSTGVPKGVVVQHRPVVNLIEWVTNTFAVGPHDRLLFVTSLCFDLSVYDIFGVLAAGGSVRIASEQELREPEQLVSILAHEPITFWDSAPPTLQQLVPFFAGLGHGADTGRLRLVFLSGDWIPVRLPNELRAAFPQAQVVSLGGATEATVWSNFFPIGAVDPAWVSIPYGRPIQNARYYILDRALEPCPIGVPGDLYIGGECLALCYAKDPALTAQKYRPDPYSESPGAPMYWTGDRARFWADGTIEFLGRVDSQVKIRGFRIELGEIETVLAHSPAVQAAVVIVREDRPGDRRLVAYVVPSEARPEADDDPARGSRLPQELRAFLKQRLPEYMIPAVFVALAEIPLSPSGKINRRALPAPDQEHDTAAGPYTAPRTPREAVLATIWAQVLGTTRVGVHDNFFEIGGDSLLALQLVARTRQAGLEISPRLLFAHQTIAELADALDSQPAQQADQGLVTGALPLSIPQHWLLSCGRAEASRPFWHVVRVFDVPPGLDTAALAQVTAGLLLHHDALRARFVETEAGWHTFIAPPDERVPFVTLDLAAVPDSQLSATIEREGIAAQSVIDLAEGPLMLVVYMDCGPARAGRLLVAVHHLVMDGLSTWIVLDDLLQGYEQLQRGAALQLPPKTMAFSAWTAHLRAYAQSPELDVALRHWLQLPWNAIPPLPYDYPASREEAVVESVRELVTLMDYEETQQLLRILPSHYQSQMVDGLLAALLSALMAWSPERWFGLMLMEGGRDPLPGMREDEDMSRTVGWFAYALHMILERPDDSAPAAVLEATLRQRRGHHGLCHGLYHYLRNDPAVDEQLAGLGNYDILFNYSGQMPNTQTALQVLPAVERCSMQGTVERALYVIEFRPIIAQGRLQVVWVYSERLHRRETIECLNEHLFQTLRALIAGARAEPQARASGRPHGAAAHTPPRTPPEAVLAGIWAQTLGAARVGIHDNFFALGGDELLAQQIVARARLSGLKIAPRQLFTHQTVAELAAALDLSPAVHADQDLIVGPLPTSDGQAWLLECGYAEATRAVWNVVRLFDVPPGLDTGALAQVTARLLLHHDLLRARFVLTEAGWHTFIAPPDERVPFVALDLAAVPDSELSAAVEREGKAVQSGLNLAEGPLMLVVHMDCGPQRAGRLLVVFHHLVVDGLSVWIVLDDLLQGYQQLASGAALQLPPKTTPFVVWSAHLNAYAQSAAVEARFAAWSQLPWNRIPPLPRDHPTPPAELLLSDMREVRGALSHEETQQLLRLLPARYQAQMVDALLAALLSALMAWSPERWFGVLCMEGGRDRLPGMREDQDMSRTVGWFSRCLYLILERPDDSAPAALLAAAAQQHQDHHALFHGLYYHMRRDTSIRERLHGLTPYEIFFNYAGQMSTSGLSMPVRPAAENCATCGESELAGNILECLPDITDGRINVRWSYNQRLHNRATIERLSEDFLQLLRSLLG